MKKVAKKLLSYLCNYVTLKRNLKDSDLGSFVANYKKFASFSKVSAQDCE